MNSLICLPIVEKTIERAIESIKVANKLADIIEIRLDFLDTFKKSHLELFISVSTKPLIITFRTKEGDSSSAINPILLENNQLGKNIFIDNEYNKPIKIHAKDSYTPITSYHNFEKTNNLEESDKIISKMKEKSDFVKYVTMAKSINDNFICFELLERNENLICFCMGLKGEISRLLTSKYGSVMTFASSKTGKKSAPGQIEYNELINVYNFKNINKKTEVYGIIGKYAENTKSKYLHNPIFKENQINAVFLPFKIETLSELSEFLDNFRKYDFLGAAVTIPFKETIIPFLDELDPTAEVIGAVNTIKNINGKLIGYNTDCIGAINALKTVTSLRKKKVLMLGAGGAARAIVYGLKLEQSEIFISNRTSEKATKMADEFSAKVISEKELPNVINNFDIVINSTSVGMYPENNESILDIFPTNKIVMDIVYKPLLTKFLKMAKSLENIIITGENMLVWQAIAQQKIWTDKQPDFKKVLDYFNQIPD